MPSALKAGAAYFLLVFAAGIVLGTLRALFIVPAIGETAAVALELPVMLAISWVACGFVLRRIAVPSEPGLRLVMGLAAFALLLVAEAGLSVLLAARTLGEHVALYREAPAFLGLVGQVAFALFPVLRKNAAGREREGRIGAGYG